jgi:hypothetical protein
VDANITIKNLTGKNTALFKDGNLNVKISGSILSACQVEPFVNAGCLESDKQAFCNNLKRYNATAACQTAYPDPCGLSNLQGTYLCPVAPPEPPIVLPTRVFTETFETSFSWQRHSTSPSASWAKGSAVSNGGGGNSAYISNNNGAANVINPIGEEEAYLYKNINLPATSGYDFSFWWKGGGDALDGMEVCLVPESEFDISDLWENCQSIGSVDSEDYESNIWRQNDGIFHATAGNYYLVFAWFNWDYGHSFAPIAIDDITIDIKPEP